jgi:hypothetical protein
MVLPILPAAPQMPMRIALSDISCPGLKLNSACNPDDIRRQCKVKSVKYKETNSLYFLLSTFNYF